MSFDRADSSSAIRTAAVRIDIGYALDEKRRIPANARRSFAPAARTGSRLAWIRKESPSGVFKRNEKRGRTKQQRRSPMTNPVTNPGPQVPLTSCAAQSYDKLDELLASTLAQEIK
jgi:hypothetical protein